MEKKGGKKKKKKEATLCTIVTCHEQGWRKPIDHRCLLSAGESFPLLGFASCGCK